VAGGQFGYLKPLRGDFFELSFKVGIVDFKSAPFRVVRLARYSSDLDAITPGRVRFKTKQSQRAECQPVPRLLHGFGLTPYYT